MPDALVTGASGFVGSHVAAQLAQDGWTVHCPTRSLPSPGDSTLRWIPCDLTRNVDGLPASVDVVLHFAAETDASAPLSRLVEANVAATARLAEYAADSGAGRLVYASTGGVYGFSTRPAVEEDPTHPINDYSRTKLMGEEILGSFGGRLAVQVMRLYFPYGPGQNGRLVAGLVDRVASGRPVRLNDAYGHPLVNPVHIDDLVTFVCRSVERRLTGTFNVAGSETFSIRELAEAIAASLGRKVTYEIDGTDHGKRLLADITRICDATDHTPRVSLREGLSRLVRRAAAAA